MYTHILEKDISMHLIKPIHLNIWNTWLFKVSSSVCFLGYANKCDRSVWEVWKELALVGTPACRYFNVF